MFWGWFREGVGVNMRGRVSKLTRVGMRVCVRGVCGACVGVIACGCVGYVGVRGRSGCVCVCVRMGGSGRKSVSIVRGPGDRRGGIDRVIQPN